MIFDFKMEYLRRKARLVTGGHVTEPPPTITYVRVVSREARSISLILATLNDFPVNIEDIQKMLKSRCLSHIRYGHSWDLSLVEILGGRP